MKYQELPNIKNVEVTNIEQKEYESELEYNDEIVKDEKAYYVDLKITYDKDLEYPDEISLVLAHVNDKLEIVKMD